jgi:putative ABC transport system permease protein
MAGFFPAVVLSKFQPVKVLKNAGGGLKLFSKIGLRKSLLVIQFSLSLIFIISVLVLYNQLKVFTGTSHGFVMDDKIVVKVNKVPYQRLQVELLKQSNIESVAAASHVPAAGITYGDGFKKQISDTEGTSMDYFYVDANYLPNMSLKLIAGRNFEESAGESNRNFMVVNESAVRAFHFKSVDDALGQSIFMESDSAEFKIIGVVKDYNHQVLMEKLGPMALRYNPEEFKLLQVKYSGTYESAAKTIEEVWAKTNEGYKIEYKSFEDEIMLFYKTVFNDFVKIIGVLAALAIIISCLGLLGMAIYTTETRLKEVSIRKVLGSSNEALVLLLSKGFLKLILIAVVIAVPAAWFINNLWLEMIAYRTEVSFTVIFSGVAILLVLGVLTIGSQTLRAAFTNPVDNLKNE